MGVHDGSQRAHVPSESLGEEKVAGCSVHVCHRRVSQCVQGIEAVETSFDLPGLERHLDPALGDAFPG